MPELEIKDTVKVTGTSRYVPLPAWLCNQLGIEKGTEYTLVMQPDSEDTMTVVFAVAGQHSSRKAPKR